MRLAQYPERRCREAVWNQVGMAYQCEVTDLHTGPCASQSVATSIAAREAWEAAHPDEVDQQVDGGDIVL